jgi:uncharacterized protein YbbK (DUF523 family)
MAGDECGGRAPDGVERPPLLVSACLVGLRTRLDGAALSFPGVRALASAVLKARSPSCGVGCTYDGTFSHSPQGGSGVTGALLARECIGLYTEEDWGQLMTRPRERNG